MVGPEAGTTIRSWTRLKGVFRTGVETEEVVSDIAHFYQTKPTVRHYGNAERGIRSLLLILALISRKGCLHQCETD
jgi:hypothetical protein